MIHLEWPWSLILLPLPVLIRYLLPPAKPVQAAGVRIPFIDDFTTVGVTGGQPRGRWWLPVAASIGWICLVLAAARPQWLGPPIQLPTTGRDLMLAVDLSGSMSTRDFMINGKIVDRLEATKAIAGDFISRRNGDRIGLILFGQQAYLVTPLTFDRTTVNKQLEEAVIGLAGKTTAIGDAIGLMIKRIRPDKSADQVLILMTDGANTAGAVSPLKAAELAAAKGLKIYTIGIGADQMEIQTLFGRQRINPSADLDEDGLTRIAEKTGGRYFRAKDSRQLAQIYEEIDRLEPVKQPDETFRPTQALFHYPLLAALMIGALLYILPESVRFRR